MAGGTVWYNYFTGWTAWSAWSECDDTCEYGTTGGKKDRTRFHLDADITEQEDNDCTVECFQDWISIIK